MVKLRYNILNNIENVINSGGMNEGKLINAFLQISGDLFTYYKTLIYLYQNKKVNLYDITYEMLSELNNILKDKNIKVNKNTNFSQVKKKEFYFDKYKKIYEDLDENFEI